MPRKDLQHAAVSATLWSGVDAFSRQGLQFVVSIVLARLLTPQDFGTVGLLAIFIGVAGVFVDSGFSSALIQRREVSQVDLSSVFFFNIGISIFVATLLCLSASWIAEFYRMPALKPLTWILAVNLVFGSLGAIQGVLLTRALDFRKQCLISLAAQFISSAVAMVLAWQQFGVWSLAVQSLLATMASTLLLWLSSTWRPQFVFSLSAIRSLFRFGSFLLFSAVLDTLFSRLNSLVIGRFYSAKELGYYSRAENTCLIPGALISNILGRVAFPIFAAAREDTALLKAGLRKAIMLAMMVNIPAMLGLAITARPLVLLLFGEQWLPSVPYLQILSLAGILWPLHVLNLNVLTAQGHSNLFFRLEVIKKSIGILVVGTAAFFGIVAIAWSLVLTGIICFCINAHYSGRLVGYGVWLQATDLLPYACLGAIMAACSWSVTLLPLTSPLWMLTCQVLIGAATYSGLCAILGLPAFKEAWDLVHPILGKRVLQITAGNP